MIIYKVKALANSSVCYITYNCKKNIYCNFIQRVAVEVFISLKK